MDDPHGKLVAVQLAQQDRARRLQPLDRSCVVGWVVSGENLRARSGRDSLHTEHVLDANRYARQGWKRLAAFGHGIYFFCLLQRTLAAQS